MFDGQHHGAKASLDASKGFQRRQHQSANIRSTKREGALEKKRRQGNNDEADFIENPMDPWSFNNESPPKTVPVALLPVLVDLARSADPRERYQGVMLIRKLLAVQENAPIDKVVEADIADVLIACMCQHDDLQLQFEASWALSNIASGNAAHAHYVIDKGAVPLWIGHLSSPSADCQEQATWAIGNIAGEGAKCRDFLLHSGAMPPLLTLITSNPPTLSLMQSAVWALSNLCRFKPAPALDLVYPAVAVLCDMIGHPDLEVSLDAAWALSYISEGSKDRVELLVQSGILPTFVSMLSAENAKYHMPAIRVIGNVCAGIDTQTQAVINYGALGTIPYLLDPRRPRAVRKEAMWALSNIGAGTQPQIQALVAANIIPEFVKGVGAYEVEIKKEAIWALANIATNGSHEQIGHLVDCGTLQALSHALSLGSDTKIITVVLECMLTILEDGKTICEEQNIPNNHYVKVLKDCDGDVQIEAMLTHSNSGIKSLANDVLTSFFNYDYIAAPSNTQTGHDMQQGGAYGGAYDGSGGFGGNYQDPSGGFGHASVPQSGFNLL